MTSEHIAISLLAQKPEYILETWSELFTSSHMRALYNAMKDQYNRGESVDVIQAAVIANVPMSEATKCSEYFSIDPMVLLPLKDAWINRELRRIENACKDYSGIEALAFRQNEMAKIDAQLKSGSVRDTSHGEFIQEMQSDIALIKTGLYKYDDAGLEIGGLEGGEICFIAARPSVGKTAFLVQLALNISKHCRVDFHSFEMTATKIRRRFISNLSNVFVSKIKRRDLNPAQWSMVLNANDNLKAMPISIYGSASLNIDGLCAAIRETDASVIMVDHLSCIAPTVKGNKNDMVGELSNKLRKTAKATNKTIIVAVQLNRAIEKEDRTPQLSDIRDTGEIEQDADTVLFLTQPDRQTDIETRKSITRMDVHALKVRDGEVGVIGLMFNRPVMRIFDESAPEPTQTHIDHF